MWFLDTSICIYFLKGEYPGIAEHISSRNPSDIKIPAIVEAELRFCVENSKRKEKNQIKLSQFLSPYQIIPFDSRASLFYASLRLQLQTEGASIGANDMLIAATVLAMDGTLVTANVKEFSRVKGLKLEKWATG
ncbi:VapC toxin family PIN domain ribonuclease [Candidatus Fermentibacteria bacterium]|nr:MAG: VapC toxin family PIN domain ribonuclease [Candidatus Fermentibacteria bacterium]